MDFQHLEKLIRSGAAHAARAELKEYSPKTRGEWERYANLAWRCGIPDHGVRLLSPMARASTPGNPLLTPGEQAEYAACLVRLRVVEEGLMRLNALAPETLPKVLLYRALGLVSQWRYEESLTPLRAYISLDEVPPYQRLVARVNLLAALVAERKVEEAEEQFATLSSENRKANHALLLANSYELGAANLVMAGRWREAEKRLAIASEAVADKDSRDYNYIRKWKAILSLLRESGAEKAVGELSEVRRLAQSQGDWESMRDIDRFLAVGQGSEEMFLYVYFGTPFECFREKLVKFFPKRVEIPEQYSRDFGGGDEVVDVLTVDSEKSRALHATRVSFRLLQFFASDFYVPFSLPQLHFGLFPGEFFNPLSSPNRLHQAVLRLRSSLEAEGIPLGIEEDEGRYRLFPKRPCSLMVSRPGADRDPNAIFLLKLRQSWPQEEFTLKMASDYLGINLRTLSRLVSDAVQKGRLRNEGKGRASRYRFPEPDES